MRLAIFGYGNLGRGVEYAVRQNPDMELVGVFTQPDRPVGRGQKLEASPVKRVAEANGIPVFQFERVRRQAGLDCMRSLRPDLVVTAAFGQILSKKLLEVPKMGTVNVHASLLPRHRGAAPINWSIIQGETVTGVTTMLTDEGMDTGAMLLARRVEILPDETAGELTARLSETGAALLKETIEKYAAGEIQPVPQNEAEMTYEPMLTKELGVIDWGLTAGEIACLVRGVNPWPGAQTTMNGGTLKIWSARAASEATDCEPGTVLRAGAKEGLFVACGGGTVLEIVEMQAPNAKRMNAKVYLNGKKIQIGIRFGEE